MNKNKHLSLVVLAVCLFLSNKILAKTVIKGLRIWPSPVSTRLVFDVSEPVKYKLFTLSSPNRIVIDFSDASLKAELKAISLIDTRIVNIRTGKQDNGNLRVVLETDAMLLPKDFTLTPNEYYGHRLVLDLEEKDKKELLSLFDLDQLTEKNLVKTTLPTSQRIYTIAIDAGHGGEDPGAIGPRGTKEKDVVLRVAKYLKKQIDKKTNMRAFLIRNGDYYVGLRDRMLRARKQHSDLFISIHADAFTNAKAKGGSVYVLSDKGASSEAAKWLATSENKADLIGGVSLDDKGDMLASVLLDLSQAANEKESLNAASQVLSSLGQVTTLHKPKVERAGFLVLKSPDIPSILVETGFISNPITEKKLRDSNYNEKLAHQIMKGVADYFSKKN